MVGGGREGLPPASLVNVNVPAFALLSVFTVTMARVGARLAHRLDAARLKQLFAILLAVVAARMLWQVVSG